MDYLGTQKNSEERQISKINAAGLININIEELWKECYHAMGTGNYVLWNSKLDALWIILGGDEKEDSDAVKSYDKIDLKLHQLGSLGKSKVGFVIQDTGLTRAKQYLILKEKSLFLRRLQNSQGKGTAYDNGDNDDFE